MSLQMIVMAIALEVMGLVCWASICCLPMPERSHPRQVDWQQIAHDSWVGIAITTGLVVTSVLSIVCWF